MFLALDLKPEEDEAECIHVRELVFRFAEMGHDVMVLASRGSEWSPHPPRPRLDVRCVGGGPTFAETARVLREAAPFRPDVVYERRFLPKVSAVVSTLREIPAIVEINGLVEDEMKMQGKAPKRTLPPPLRDYLIRTIFRKVNRIVAVTDGLAEAMLRLYDVPEDRIRVVENAANTSLFQPLNKTECRLRLGLPVGGRIVIFEGGLYPWHGVGILLQAFGLMDEDTKDVKLLIVGDGPCRGELQELSHSLGLGRRVIFVGRIPYDRVPTYIGAADVGVGPFPSERNERIGLSPLKIYEYVACGRPVVVSRIRGVANWIEKEHLGLTAEPGNSADLARKLEEALTNESLANDMIIRGPAVVGKDHSWDSVANRILTLCSEVIEGG